MGYEDLDVVDPTAGEAKSGQEATISEVRAGPGGGWRRVAAGGGCISGVRDLRPPDLVSHNSNAAASADAVAMRMLPAPPCLQERAKAFSSYRDYLGKDITSLVVLPVWINQPFTMLQVWWASAGRGRAGGCAGWDAVRENVEISKRVGGNTSSEASHHHMCHAVQCMGELMEYTDLLDTAAATEDPYERCGAVQGGLGGLGTCVCSGGGGVTGCIAQSRCPSILPRVANLLQRLCYPASAPHTHPT